MNLGDDTHSSFNNQRFLNSLNKWFNGFSISCRNFQSWALAKDLHSSNPNLIAPYTFQLSATPLFRSSRD